MSTIFTKIINGEIPCHKVAESDAFLAFLDVRPIARGHTLVIPKQEIDYIFDLSDEQLGGIMAFSRSVAAALESIVDCKRVGIMVAGLEVPHAHVHLVPIQNVTDLNFANSKAAGAEELRELAVKLQLAVNS